MRSDLYLSNILRLESLPLQVALCTAQGADRERLLSRFPECFSRIRRDLPRPIPASLVRGVAAELARREFPQNLDMIRYNEVAGWHAALERLGIPHVTWDEEAGTFPPAMWHRVADQYPRAGLRVFPGGKEHRLVSYWAQDAALDKLIRHSGDAIVRIVDHKVIDFKA